MKAFFTVLFVSSSMCFGQVSINSGSLQNAKLNQTVTTVTPPSGYVLVASAGKSGTQAGVTNDAINVPAGATVIVVLGSFGGIPTTITDNDTPASTFKPVVQSSLTGGGGYISSQHIATNVQANAAYQVRITGGGRFPTIHVLVYTGGSGFIDKTNSNASGGVNTLTTSITPSVNNCLVVGGFDGFATSGVSVTSPLVAPLVININSGGTQGTLSGTNVQAVAGAINVNFTQGINNDMAVTAASYLP